MSIREIKESPWEQGVEESRPYILDTSPWGGSPSSPVVKLYYDSDLTDVSLTNLSGSASIAGDNITTPVVTGLAEDILYRLEIKFVTNGRTEECYGFIWGKR
jgi:hypothetical protein